MEPLEVITEEIQIKSFLSRKIMHVKLGVLNMNCF